MVNITPMDRFTKIYFLLWGIFAFIAIITFSLYKLGFRVSNNFHPVKVTQIELTSNEIGLQIFIDNREKKISVINGKYRVADIIPGFHSILISKNDFWPWTKTVYVNQNDPLSLFAFIFPMGGIKTTVVSPTEKIKYAEIIKNIFNATIPKPQREDLVFTPDESVITWIQTNVPSAKISFNKNTALYVEDNTIYVAWISETLPPPHDFCEENPCKFLLPVVIPTEKIKSVDFYKDRSDVIIFSAGATIYGVEVSHEGTQNFQPLYKGDDPYFYQTKTSELIIKDGDVIFTSNL